MPSFGDLDELARYLQLQINDSLETDVADVALNTLKEHVIEDVYDKYTPDQYLRSGAILQDSNYKVEMVSENTLSVGSDYEENGKDITTILETGVGYTWRNSRIYKDPFPRPFTENAQSELEDKGLAVNTMKESLRKKGFVVE